MQLFWDQICMLQIKFKAYFDAEIMKRWRPSEIIKNEILVEFF